MTGNRNTDTWMDEEPPLSSITPGSWSMFRRALDPARSAPAQLIAKLRTTPGQMTAVTFILVLAIIAAGGAMVFSSNMRQQQLNTLVTQTEPLSNASQELFSSLAVTGTVAATGFIEDGDDSTARSSDYQASLLESGQAVVRAANGISDINSRDMDLVRTIQSTLPRYVTLVTQASDNNRMRNPVGIAYLAQASILMQEELLPAAAELYSRTVDTLNTQQVALSRPMWFPLTGLFAATIALILTQFWLAAKTNRRINLGFLFATFLMIIATLWASIAAATSWYTANHGLNSASDPLDSLTSIRITAQQTRTTEALSLMQREYGTDTQGEFSARIAAIDSALEEVRSIVVKNDSTKGTEKKEILDDTREILRRWDAAHAEMVALLQSGDYSNAITIAVGGSSSEYNSAQEFRLLDHNIQSLISSTRRDLQNYLLENQLSAQQVSEGVVVLMVLATLSVLFGIRRRLQEYL